MRLPEIISSVEKKGKIEQGKRVRNAGLGTDYSIKEDG